MNLMDILGVWLVNSTSIWVYLSELLAEVGIIRWGYVAKIGFNSLLEITANSRGWKPALSRQGAGGVIHLCYPALNKSTTSPHLTSFYASVI